MKKVYTRKALNHKAKVIAIAVFNQDDIKGEVIVRNYKNGVQLIAYFSSLPKGKHGFHIHKAGDLRGEGCQGACDHFHVGPAQNHGGSPSKYSERHTGDLGNVEISRGHHFKKSYYIKGISVKDLWGRSIIVHEDEDDLGKGGHDDSITTGHSGKRIGCAIFGRGSCSKFAIATRKH